MITKQTKEYGDLFRQASEDLKKYNTSYQLISDPKTQDKTPILKTNYVVIELTADDYVPKTYYIQKSEGVYEIDNSLTFTPGQTYYYDAAEQITSLDEYFSYIEDLNHINRKYTILPLDEEPFVIDANTRTITVPKSFKTNGISVQGDEAAETIYFIIDRFFDVTSGEILLNGINIKDLSFEDLRSEIGLVPQKGMLFSGTVESNLKFGNDELTEEEMIKALKVSEAYEFVMNKEEKLLYPINQGGTNVSGGQRQRLCIARAVAMNPNIYVFDDSFSALDYKTDSKVRKNLNENCKNSTKVIIAQRVATVMNADKILVLDEGKVVGLGTHKELYKKCKVYKEIALSQLSEEELV